MSEAFLDSFLWHRPDGYLEGLYRIRSEARSKAECKKRKHYKGQTTATEVPTIDVKSGPAQYNIPIPDTLKDWDFVFEATFGSIDKIYYRYTTTVTCSSPKGGNCCCTCETKSTVKVKLEDTYHFEGGNNRALRWLDSIGTGYVVTGEFTDYIEDHFTKCPN